MKGTNPYMDQGIDIRLLPDSCPMEKLCGSDFDIDSEEDIEHIAIPAWRTREDWLIAIRDMDTSHIKHCIKMIYKSNGTWRHQYLKYFKEELIKRKYLPEPPKVIYIDE